jgi:hypothetical protein
MYSQVDVWTARLMDGWMEKQFLEMLIKSKIELIFFNRKHHPFKR